MSDYMDFEYTLKQVTNFCASGESLIYTPYYKFDYPNSHRVQGGLRTKDGQIEGALILFPDSDDKHLVWPVKLEFHLLANLKEKTELLGTQKRMWDFEDAQEICEEIQWSRSVCCSLEELKNKDVIDNDNSVHLAWAVKLLFPDPKGSKSAKHREDMKDVLTSLSEQFSPKSKNIKRRSMLSYFQEDNTRKNSISQQSSVGVKSGVPPGTKPTSYTW